MHDIALLKVTDFVGGKKMNSKGNLILSMIWIILSLLWFFWIKNMMLGIIWLCAGVFELIVFLVRTNK